MYLGKENVLECGEGRAWPLGESYSVRGKCTPSSFEVGLYRIGIDFVICEHVLNVWHVLNCVACHTCVTFLGRAR